MFKEFKEKILQAFENLNYDVKVRIDFLASKINVDYLWTLWAKTRVPYDGQPMEDWAKERFERLKSNMELYKSL